MKHEERRLLVRLIEQQNIHFDPPTARWPSNHGQTFRAIQKLGQTTYQHYHEIFTIESHQKPWRARTKQRAHRIAALAQLCHDAQQNEFGWRLKLEPEIFSRFTTEVACRSCSSRLWRSEIEVLLEPADIFAELNLEDRQKKRNACSCSEIYKRLDLVEDGISRLFHDRADAPIKYREEDTLFAALPKKEKPDRVFGLRKTRRIMMLLDDSEDTRPELTGTLLGESLECGPFDEPRDPVLFPFLILEAKSERGDSFDDIETQTAFGIKKLLDIQCDLTSATGKSSKWQSGPLVWFLSNRGDEWRIAAAHVQLRENKRHYNITRLWSGGISSHDGALQLILVLDYIFDWARDFYRETIINELRILSGRNLSSFADDTEVISLGDPLQRYLRTQDPTENYRDPDGVNSSPPDPMRSFDTDWTAIRLATLLDARLSALYITKENLATMLKSFSSEAVAQRYARDCLRLLTESWRVTSTALEALEFMWTGHCREDPDLYGSNKCFCAAFSVAAYISNTWDLVTELTYVAVAEDALAELKNYVNLQQPIQVHPSELPMVNQKHLVGYFRHFRQSSVSSILHAAMTRRCFSSRLVRDKDYPDAFFFVAEEPVDTGICYRMDVAMLPDQRPKARELVASAYNQCKRGMRAPDETFLRISSIYHRRDTNSENVASLWDPETASIPKAATYAMLGSKLASSGRMSRLCLYLLDDLYDAEAVLKEFASSESCLVFPIIQPQERRSAASVEWNLIVEGESVSSEQPLLRQFQSECLEVARRKIVGLTSINSPRTLTGKRLYHETKELPPHMRSKLKSREGSWVHFTSSPSPNPYDDARGFADSLVGRRYNVKSVTCLYAQSNIPGPRGITSTTRAASPLERRLAKGSPQRREIREKIRRKEIDVKDIKIRAICQRGDHLNFGRFSLPEYDEQMPHRDGERVGFYGDWLTDEELDMFTSQGLLNDRVGDDSTENRIGLKRPLDEPGEMEVSGHKRPRPPLKGFER